MKHCRFYFFVLFLLASPCLAQSPIVGEWKIVSSGGKPPPSFLKSSVLVIQANQEIVSVDLSDLKSGVSFAGLVKNAMLKGTWKIENNLFFASNSLLRAGSVFKIENQKLIFEKDPYLSDQGKALTTVYERRN